MSILIVQNLLGLVSILAVTFHLSLLMETNERASIIVLIQKPFSYWASFLCRLNYKMMPLSLPVLLIIIWFPLNKFFPWANPYIFWIFDSLLSILGKMERFMSPKTKEGRISLYLYIYLLSYHIVSTGKHSFYTLYCRGISVSHC